MHTITIQLTFVKDCGGANCVVGHELVCMCGSLLHLMTRRWAQRMGLMEGLSGSYAMWACLSSTKESLLRCCLDLVSPRESHHYSEEGQQQGCISVQSHGYLHYDVH